MTTSTKRLAADTQPQPTDAMSELAAPPPILTTARCVLATLGILAAAILLRVYQIEIRPFHSDEGVNFHFIREVLRNGYFPYSGNNYHGPSYFYLVSAFVALFDDSILALRSVSIVSGVVVILAMLPLIATEGVVFFLLSATLLAISPSLVFHSRYAIHEMLLIASQAWLAVSVYLWLVRGKTPYAYVGAIALAVACATKETCVLTFAALAAALLVCVPVPKLWRTVSGQWQTILSAFLLFFFVAVFVFTGGLQNTDALKEFVIAIPQWTGRGFEDHGHFKPFWYYLVTVAWPTEPLLCIFTGVVLLLAPVLLLFSSRLSTDHDRLQYQFFKFSLVWTVVIFLLYSMIRYKTPWIIVNMTLPAIICCSSFLALLISGRLGRANSGLVATTGVVLFFALTVSFVVSTAHFNYGLKPTSAPYGSDNPYSYVHTSPGMLDAIDMLEEVWARKPDAKVLVAVPQYWPLPYYLRKRSSQLGYYRPDDIAKASEAHEVVIIDPSVSLDESRWDKTYLRLSDVQEAHVCVRRR